jgi:hypothetical protein
MYKGFSVKYSHVKIQMKPVHVGSSGVDIQSLRPLVGTADTGAP